MYDCTYCSFFLAKEISRYHDENTYISTLLYQFSHRRIFRNTGKDISNIVNSDSLQYSIQWCLNIEKESHASKNTYRISWWWASNIMMRCLIYVKRYFEYRDEEKPHTLGTSCISRDISNIVMRRILIQQNSTKSWIDWVCNLTKPNPEYCHSQQTVLHQPMDWLACSLTLPNPEYGQSQPTEFHQPINWLNAQPVPGWWSSIGCDWPYSGQG